MPELTQRQIAHLSKVSQATVSRVLNGDERVDEDLRRRVHEVFEQHGYVPDARAQSLRSQKSGALGLVVHRSPQELERDSFFSALIANLLDTCGKHDFHLCVDAARTARSRRSVYEELLRTRRVDGLILVEPQDKDPRIARLFEEGFPFVLIGRYENQAPFEGVVYAVDNDNVEAGRMAAAYLRKRGHERIAYIGGPKGVIVSEDRLRGYRAALTEAGIELPTGFCAYGDFSEAAGHRAMLKFLELDMPPTAVVAVDDVTAVGAMRAAREMGRTIPGDIALLGFNDSSFCPYTEPALTSVSVDIPALAAHAGEMLMTLIAGETPVFSRQIVPSHIVERASC